MSLDLNQLHLFSKVVECKSFIGASRQLKIPKTTISRKVAELEERLGVRLLDRTSRQLSLTDAGSMYYEHCSRIMEQVEEAELLMLNAQQTPSGKLRVSMPENTGMMFNRHLLEEFLQAYPKISLEIVVNPNAQTQLDKGVDAAFLLGPLPDSSLVAKSVSRLIDRIYVSPYYLDKVGQPKSPQDLLQFNCIEVDIDGYRGPWQLSNNGETETIAYESRLILPSISLAHQAVLNGLGAAKLPNAVVSQDVQSGRLVSVLDDWWFEERNIYMVYPTRRHIPLKLKAFIEFMNANEQRVRGR